jgi:tetratricopeptide (TPR) repeat protein
MRLTSGIHLGVLSSAEGCESRPGGGIGASFLRVPGLEKVALVVFVIFGPLFTGGCGPQPLTPEAVNVLETGIAAYDQGQDDYAISELTNFLAEYDRSARADEAWYYRGLAYDRQGDYRAARADMLNAVDATDRQRIRAGALVALGDIAHRQGRPQEAIEWYSQSLQHLPRGLTPRDRVLSMLGDLCQRLGHWREADRYFDQLIGDFAEYPGSAALVSQAALRTHGRCWTIRIAVFDTQAEAVAMIEQFGLTEDAPYIRPSATPDGLVFYVQLGRYDLYRDAAEAAQQLRDGMIGEVVVGR